MPSRSTPDAAASSRPTAPPGLTPGLATAIVATIREPLVVLDQSLCVVAASDAFYSTFEVDARETLGRSLFDLGNGQWDVPELRRLLEDVLPGRRQFVDFEITHDFQHIGKRQMLLNGRRLATGDDRDELILLTIEDITHRVVWQEKEARLEARVKARTEALDSANRELEQRNKELQYFAYVASHDLQEPLRKISAFASILHEEYAAQLDDDAGLFLERIRNAAGRMSELIEDLLAFSKIGTQRLAVSRIDLTGVVHSVLSDLEVAIQETGATVDIEPLPTVVASEMQMRQLFQNLLSNALKFQPRGHTPEIRLQARSLAGVEPPMYRITVRDNGIGFDEKYLERVFAPFQRLHNRGAYRGTGVGLAICRRIVDRHGGSISATSAPGEGTTFIIDLPERPPEHSVADPFPEGA